MQSEADRPRQARKMVQITLDDSHLPMPFKRFCAACPVLGANDPAVRASRLSLAALTLKQLELALDLLGIATPERI